MLKIWGRTNSANVQKVLWVCEELGLNYERVDAGMQFGVVNEAYYRKLNPNSRVPTIEDEGFVLWESNAIVRYLACKHGAGSMWPGELKMRADSDRWMDWCSTMLAPCIVPLFWQLVRTPAEKRDQASIAKCVRETAQVLQVLEQGMEGREFVAGTGLTMGDIPLGVHLYRWFNLENIERPRPPNIEAWYRRLQQRPAYRKIVMIGLS